MKKKILMVLCGALSMALLLAACGKTETQEKKEPEKPEYADEDFIQDMSAGLQDRWTLVSEDEGKEGYDEILVNSQEYKDMMISYVNAELDKIEKYQDEKFEDSKLKEKALAYINLLKEHKEICEYISVDYDRYLQEYDPIYNERSKIITQMVDSYNLTVDDEFKNYLSDFSTNAKLVEQNEGRDQEINAMLANIQFEATEDDGTGWRTYPAVVENTTSIDFKSLNVSINLLNEEGVIVETTYDNVSAFNKGAKVQFEFMTDKDFASTQVIGDWWE